MSAVEIFLLPMQFSFCADIISEKSGNLFITALLDAQLSGMHTPVHDSQHYSSAPPDLRITWDLQTRFGAKLAIFLHKWQD